MSQDSTSASVSADDEVANPPTRTAPAGPPSVTPRSQGLYPNMKDQDKTGQAEKTNTTNTTTGNAPATPVRSLEGKAEPSAPIGDKAWNTIPESSSDKDATGSSDSFWKNLGKNKTPFRLLGRFMGSIQDWPKVRNKVHVVKEVGMPMRDGVKLVASIFAPCSLTAQAASLEFGSPDAANMLPEDLLSGQYPTILIRDPYNRKHMEFLCQRLAERGYIVVIQDTRGRGESEGEMNPLANETEDGQDTLAWIRGRAWFEACPKLGAWGMSYLGIVQYAMLAGPDQNSDVCNLDAIVPIMCSSDVYDVFRPGGGYSMGLFARWHCMYL